MLVDLRLDLGPVSIVIAFLRGGVDGVDLAAGDPDEGVVVGIERLGDQDLVVVIQDALQNHLQSFAAAGGSQDIPTLQRNVQLGIVAADRLDQLGDTGRGSILQNRRVEISDGVKEHRGRFNIRLTNIQMIDLAALLLRCQGIRMEFAHGGKTAFFDLAGKFHFA